MTAPYERHDNFGQDGIPHLTYYDKPTQLSFVVDVVHPGKVAVSHGGYAEPVIAVFSLRFDGDDLSEVFSRFQNACIAYAQAFRISRQYLNSSVEGD